MSIKILSFSVNDFRIDANGVAGALNHACTGRHGLYRVRGVCNCGDSVFFSLLPADGTVPERYVISPLDDITDEGVRTAIQKRWTAGFDTVGSIETGNGTLMVVFCQAIPGEEPNASEGPQTSPD